MKRGHYTRNAAVTTNAKEIEQSSDSRGRGTTPPLDSLQSSESPPTEESDWPTPSDPVIIQSRPGTDPTQPEPMLPEQFEIALAATQIRTPELIEACRAVLVKNETALKIAHDSDIAVSNIYRATATIKRKWEQICASEEWDYIPLAVPRSVTTAILVMQREVLKSYSEKKAKRRTRKRRPAPVAI